MQTIVVIYLNLPPSMRLFTLYPNGGYPRVTSFDAIKQSTDICAHRITFSSWKFSIL